VAYFCRSDLREGKGAAAGGCHVRTAKLPSAFCCRSNSGVTIAQSSDARIGILEVIKHLKWMSKFVISSPHWRAPRGYLGPVSSMPSIITRQGSHFDSRMFNQDVSQRPSFCRVKQRTSVEHPSLTWSKQRCQEEARRNRVRKGTKTHVPCPTHRWGFLGADLAMRDW